MTCNRLGMSWALCLATMKALYHVPMYTHGKIQCYNGKIHFINCNLKHFNDKIVFKIIIITHTGNPGLKF